MLVLKHLSIIIFCILFSSIIYAEVATRGGSTDQTQALIQQLGAERTRLTAENAKLKKQLKDLESEIDDVKEESELSSAKADQNINSLRTQLDNKTSLGEELKKRLADASDKIKKLNLQLRETRLSLNDKEQESALRAQEVSRLDGELKTCAANNVALSKLGFEVLDNYENKGFWDRAGQKEPFTQIKRVQIENLVDDYKYLIEDQEYSLPEDISNDAQS